MQRPILSKRLSAAAELVRDGSFIADIGTDHAYLPIYLFLEGRIRGALASDINKGPLERARANLIRYGITEGIELGLSDGLAGAEAFSPDDILILGMGGELIANIIEKAPFTRDSRIRLILQPMTHPEILRAFLAENGYAVTEERIVKEDKLYQLIVACYVGEAYSPSLSELYFGKINLERNAPELHELLTHVRGVLAARQNARMAAEHNAEDPKDSMLLLEIERIMGNEQ